MAAAGLIQKMSVSVFTKVGAEELGEGKSCEGGRSISGSIPSFPPGGGHSGTACSSRWGRREQGKVSSFKSCSSIVFEPTCFVLMLSQHFLWSLFPLGGPSEAEYSPVFLFVAGDKRRPPVATWAGQSKGAQPAPPAAGASQRGLKSLEWVVRELRAEIWGFQTFAPPPAFPGTKR